MPASPGNRVVNLKGIILAGGKSSRFGEDKALAIWNGKTLLARAVDLLRNLHLDPVVIANPQKDYSFLECPVFNDLIPAKGPLGGLFTACSLFPQKNLLVLTCDMPFLEETVLSQLMEVHTAEIQVTVFCVGEQIQPFPGIYSSKLEALLKRHLDSDELSMRSFLSRIICQQIAFSPLESKVFQNVNFPDDLNR